MFKSEMDTVANAKCEYNSYIKDRITFEGLWSYEGIFLNTPESWSDDKNFLFYKNWFVWNMINSAIIYC